MDIERKKVLRNLLEGIVWLAEKEGRRVATMTFEVTDIKYFIEAIEKERNENRLRVR